MILDAILAFIVVKMFGIEGIKILVAIALIVLVRTCLNVNEHICNSMETTITYWKDGDDKNVK